MSSHQVYLLKQRVPVDRHSGFDMRFMELCPFLDHVFYVDDRPKSTSGRSLEDVDCMWPNTRLNGFDDLSRHLDGRHDAVWIAGDYESYEALRTCGLRRIIYDNCDSRSLYYARRFRALPWSHWKSKLNSVRQCLHWGLRERKVLRGGSVVIVPAEKDREAYLRWGRGRVEVVTNGTAWIHEPPVKRRTDASDCMFHGVFSWEVNVTTAEFLAREFFPRLKTEIHNTRLRIAGHPVPDSLKKLATDSGIRMEGFVDDIRDWLSHCGVYVMPMFQGGGVKNKLLEGMAAGLPIITNTMGAEAMPADSLECFVVADGADNMADRARVLLENPGQAEELGRKARAYAEKHFDWQPLSKKYEAVVHAMAAGSI